MRARGDLIQDTVMAEGEIFPIYAKMGNCGCDVSRFALIVLSACKISEKKETLKGVWPLHIARVVL